MSRSYRSLGEHGLSGCRAVEHTPRDRSTPIAEACEGLRLRVGGGTTYGLLLIMRLALAPGVPDEGARR